MIVRRALVVDDEPDLRHALVRHLRQAKVVDEMCEIASGAEALEALRETGAAVILLDLGLPDRDGLELIPELRAIDPATQIICLTGRDDARCAVAALQAGAAAYLVKPWDRDELTVQVQRAIEAYLARRSVEIVRATAAEAPGFAIGVSPVWTRVLELARDAGRSGRSTVLIRGESGTGKDVVASLIHRFSQRAAEPYVTTNVASIPAGLLESEFFGHEGGAFTGAKSTRRGLFELASGGTLFLDEIGEMPLELQPRLLRVLEGQPFRRVGGEREIEVDVRIVAATHRDLETMVGEGRFRADLLYRLKVFEIETPPLRVRPEDVELLAVHFLARIALESSHEWLGISQPALLRLRAYAWPGNVRELRNVIERGAILSHGQLIEPCHLPSEISGEAAEPFAPRVEDPVLRPEAESAESADTEELSLESAIRRHIERVFAHCGGNLSHTARALALSRVALRKRLRAYGLVAEADESSVVTK